MAIALLVVWMLAVTPALADAAPKPPLDHAGRWITDARGRVVILHGWNMVNKLAPYQPAALGFGRDDARFLAEQGFNTVRLGIIWKGLEPEPGRIDEAYLEQTARTARMLTDEGIFVMIDFHQDLLNERFQGEGFPDWALSTDGAPNEPLLVDDGFGYTGNYTLNPALNRVFDNFWTNRPGPGGVGLQDRFAAAWRRVALRFRDEPRIFGYDLLNELWPGSQWSTCANPLGCPAFDRLLLTPFSQRVIRAIREVDRDTLAFYEPHVLFNNGAATNHGDTGDAYAGFSFHDYCLSGVLAGRNEGCGALDDITFSNAEDQSRRTGDALILTEFGATDDPVVIGDMVERADRFGVSWQQWAYWNADPVVGAQPIQGLIRDIARPPEGDNVKQDKLRLSARPYPQAVAGTPLAYDFDEGPAVFDLRYSTARADGQGRFGPGSVTEVFVPALHYPDGYGAAVRGGHVTSMPGARVLRVKSCPAAREITLRVTRGAASPRDGCAELPGS